MPFVLGLPPLNAFHMFESGRGTKEKAITNLREEISSDNEAEVSI